MDEIKDKKKRNEKKKVQTEIGTDHETLVAATASSPSEKKENKKVSDDSVKGAYTKKKSKKRKAHEDEEAEIEICNDKTPEAALPEKKESKKTKMKKKGKDDGDAVAVVRDGAFFHLGCRSDFEKEDVVALENSRMSAHLKAKLEFNGYKSLSQIQMTTFNHALDGFDLVGRGGTGQEKTLAYVLPVVESLINGPEKGPWRTGYKRSPRVLVILFTSKMVFQVAKEFDLYSRSFWITTYCVDSWSPYGPQEGEIDIFIGTPGRIKELIESGKLDIGSLKFCVLDEVDEMLDKGCLDDVELILGKIKDLKTVQTLLFSATLPQRVEDITNRFLKPDKKNLEFVGNEKVKPSVNVKHIFMPCSREARATVIPDVILCYGAFHLEADQLINIEEETVGYETNKALLTDWTRFKEVENIVRPYVSQVIRKTRQGGYKSAREVLEDYEIFYGIRTELIEAKNELLIQIYVAEYFYRFALKEKAKMLSNFKFKLGNEAHMEAHEIQWINQQLKEDDPKDLVLYADIFIRKLDASVNKMDKYVQREIWEQKNERLKCLEKMDKTVQDFEELKWIISCAKKKLKTLGTRLATRCATHCKTLATVGDRSTISRMEEEFHKLLRDDYSQGYLVKMWSEVTKGMMKLDYKEEEF